jgi:hypothetical protein
LAAACPRRAVGASGAARAVRAAKIAAVTAQFGKADLLRPRDVMGFNAPHGGHAQIAILDCAALSHAPSRRVHFTVNF